MRHTAETLAPVVARCSSWSEVCRAVGVTSATGAQTHIKSRAVKFGIDFSHFTGQGWRQGKKFGHKKPIEHYLVEGATCTSDFLRRRLIKDGVKEHKCERCGITEWMGEPAPLELDHSNGVHDDCRLENLCILCPNCHAQVTAPSRCSSVW